MLLWFLIAAVYAGDPEAGDTDEPAPTSEMESDAYAPVWVWMQAIRTLVTAELHLPPALDQSELYAKAELIVTDGKVTGYRVVLSSGNTIFDEAVHRALKSALPRFPAVPSQMLGSPITLRVQGTGPAR